jgi:hypothetical protein
MSKERRSPGDAPGVNEVDEDEDGGADEDDFLDFSLEGFDTNADAVDDCYQGDDVAAVTLIPYCCCYQCPEGRKEKKRKETTQHT